MTDYPIILDISRYQGEINAEVAKSRGVVGVIIRATVGDYYTDPLFATNYARVKAAGLLAGAYHVYNPTASAISQVNRYLSAIGTREIDFPHTIDVEVSAGQNPYTVTQNLKTVMTYVPRVRTKLPTIYTAAWFWNQYILSDGHDWTIYPLHVANYTTAPAPILPKSWTKWQIWQYSADNNGLGAFYGTQSDDVDINRFNGNYDALRAFCGLTAVPPFPPVPTPDPQTVTVTATAGLNVRSAPGGVVIGGAYYGSKWSVVDSAELNGKTWYNVSGWVHGDWVK